jgi:hypothetical protein
VPVPVDIVPPVAITVRRAMLASLRITAARTWLACVGQ